MPYTGFGRTIRKAAVVGSGNIGPDIALHLGRQLQRHGVPVLVMDISPDALDRGRKKVRAKIDKMVSSGRMKPDAGQALADGIRFVTDYDDLEGSDLVVEAVSEDLSVKANVFQRLEQLTQRTAILASNSSHIEPERVGQSFQHPARFLILHYFFPAERNPMLEVVPWEKTDPEVVRFCLGFYEEIGKIPIRVKGRYGYALNPIFEGMFLAAALCVEEGLGTTKEVDAVARKTLRMGVGPFTGMNLTGGNPLTYHGLKQYGPRVMPWFRVPRLLEEAVTNQTPWDVPGRGEKVDVPAGRAERIADCMMGAYLGVACEVAASGIVSIEDLEIGVQAGLVMEPPFTAMNRISTKRALGLVETYARDHEGFVVAQPLRECAAAGADWVVPHVHREDRGGVAVLTVRRPQVRNALNEEVFRQLREHAARIRDDASVKAAVVTGHGTKAFVAGADVSMLAALKDAAAAQANSAASQAVLRELEGLGKPVVAALNGPAMGGGLELALACTARIGVEGHPALVASPEVNLGIIPGAGGTQRLPRWIGIDNAWPMLRTGAPVSSAAALAMGLLNEASAPAALLDRAVAMARGLAEGSETVPAIPQDPIPVPQALPDADLGHRSRKIDEILRRAVLEGAKLSLEKGLALESKLFGECFATKDTRIGVETFLRKGPRAKAEFVHA